MARNDAPIQELTQQRLRELLHYDPETGVFTWLVAASKSIKAGMVAGTASKGGYVVIAIDGTKHKAHRLAWLHETGAWPCGHIDHKNLAKADNRWANLREATVSQNQGNRPLNRNNTSGVKGVSFIARNQMWRASIAVDGRRRHLGSFTNIDDAATAYAKAAREHFGEYANPATAHPR